jgi:polyisoprenoid-binding protein YceI
MNVASETKYGVPGYQAGVWDVDPVHSEVSFVVRHMVVSKVRGRFGKFEGSIMLADDPLQSSVEARIDAGSVDTNNEQRDAHVRSGDFLDTDNHPTITFVSTGVRSERDRFLVDGDLTIRGTTRPVTLTLEANGFTPDPFGGTRAGFTAHTDIDRTDFGVSYNGPIPGADNAMVLSDKISIDLEIEAVLRPDAG